MHALLARQDGLVTAAQAARHGLPTRTLRWQTRHCAWERVAPRVFLATDHPWTDRARVRAAGLWAGERAIAIPDGSAFLDRALQKHVRFERVYRAYCRNLGAAGSAAMGRLLVAAVDRADSAAERLMLRILRGAGVTGWTLGHRFGPWVIDTGDGGRRSRRAG